MQEGEQQNAGRPERGEGLLNGHVDDLPVKPSKQKSPEPKEDKELLKSELVMVQAKRYYLDVKENKMGRFVKVAEVAQGGHNSKLVLSNMSIAREFGDKLSEFSEFSKQHEGDTTDIQDERGNLKSMSIVSSHRNYYMDMKENQRGRYLRVTQTLPRGGPRTQVAIPVEGLNDISSKLKELVDAYYVEPDETELPESKSMRVDQKMFYFDIEQNHRGMYMRISEVHDKYRTAITIPAKAWPKLRDTLSGFLDDVDSPSADGDAKQIQEVNEAMENVKLEA